MRKFLLKTMALAILYSSSCFTNAFSISSPSQTLKSTTSPKSSTTAPQVISLIEPSTNIKVVLIGTMHYNPTSISTVKSTLTSLAESSTLGSVIVESCDVRWNTTMELLEEKPLFGPVLTSEMKVASDVAMEFGRPCVLGDQRINVTGVSIREALKETVVDILNPLDGGWGRFGKAWDKARTAALPSENDDTNNTNNTNDISSMGYLGPSSILDPRLLIAAPVSFAKYPLSFLARNPISTLLVFSFIAGINVIDSTTASDVSFLEASLEEQILSVVSSFSLLGLELAFFGRVMMQVLLAERNEILARNILDQCRLYADSNSFAGSGGGGSFFGMDGLLEKVSSLFVDKATKPTIATTTEDVQRMVLDESQTMYVPGTIQDTSIFSDGNTNEKVVVAILGMAHCNGIVKLLKDGMITDDDTR